jgi:hypothetical protein
MRFSAGSGPYPGDVIIYNLHPGETQPVDTFWHSSCVVWKYQAFALHPEFPPSMNIRMGDIRVNQTPEEAGRCLSVGVWPKTIFLGKTFPRYQDNWATAVRAEITASPDCNPGWYGLELIPTDPDPATLESLELEYGITQVSGIRAGGAWQVFVEITPNEEG